LDLYTKVILAKSLHHTRFLEIAFYQIASRSPPPLSGFVSVPNRFGLLNFNN